MTADRHHLDRFFSGTLNDKMVEMDTIYGRRKKQLLKDKAVNKSLGLLKKYAAELSAQMKAMHMDELCSNCAGQSGGGCCSAYMEANSDVILLLINRLYGTRITKQHGAAGQCCFLGDSGCILTIKPMFCLNYNCRHISDQATETEMRELEQLAGRLLTEQTRLESLLLHRL